MLDYSNAVLQGDDNTPDAQNDDAAAQDDDDGATEEVLDQAVDEVLEDLEGTEAEELELDESKVTTALDTVINKLRDDVLVFLGGKLSEDEVNSLTEETEEHLRQHVSDELEAAAKSAVVDVAEEVEGLVDGELEDGDKLSDIDSDLHQHEGEALANLRTMIKDAEANIEESLYSFALELEKEFLENRLSEKLGETVVLGIEDSRLTDPNNFLAKIGVENLGNEPDNSQVDETAGEGGETESQVEDETSGGDVANVDEGATVDGEGEESTGESEGDDSTGESEGDDSTGEAEGDDSTDGDDQAAEGDDSTEGDDQAGEGDDSTDGDDQAGEGDDSTDGDDQVEGDDSTDGVDQAEGDDNARLRRRQLRGSA